MNDVGSGHAEVPHSRAHRFIDHPAPNEWSAFIDTALCCVDRSSRHPIDRHHQNVPAGRFRADIIGRSSSYVGLVPIYKMAG